MRSILINYLLILDSLCSGSESSEVRQLVVKVASD